MQYLAKLRRLTVMLAFVRADTFCIVCCACFTSHYAKNQNMFCSDPLHTELL